MNNKPRIHHFVPQFWIKKFISTDGKLWGYEWNDDRIKRRSSKAMMQVFDLYTIQPGGVDDTSLETNELGVIDTAGADAIDRVLSGDHGERARLDLANFLAAQIMRDPGTLASYRPRTQEYTLALLGAVDAEDHASFAAALAAQFPGADIREDEFDHIRALSTAERAIDSIISALDAAGGFPELPFTDLIRDPKAATSSATRCSAWTGRSRPMRMPALFWATPPFCTRSLIWDQVCVRRYPRRQLSTSRRPKRHGRLSQAQSLSRSRSTILTMKARRARAFGWSANRRE